MLVSRKYKITLFIIPLLFLSTACLAANNPYKYDANYEYITTHSGVSSYLDKRTVNVYVYNPPIYVIAGEFALFRNTVDGEILNPVLIEMQFNYDRKETYSRRNGIWEKDVVNDSSVGETNRAFANALFRAAYGMDFYE